MRPLGGPEAPRPRTLDAYLAGTSLCLADCLTSLCLAENIVDPPEEVLDYLVLLVNLLVFLLISLVSLLTIWDSIACKSITLFVIFFHAIISPDYRFFSEIPSFEESQDSDSSPRREEVGRRTLRDHGGLLPPFFYRARFRESTSTTRKRQARNIYPNKTPITSGVEESNSPRRVLLLLLSNSSRGRFLKKKRVLVVRSSQRNKTLISRIEFSQESRRIGSRKGVAVYFPPRSP